MRYEAVGKVGGGDDTSWRPVPNVDPRGRYRSAGNGVKIYVWCVAWLRQLSEEGVAWQQLGLRFGRVYVDLQVGEEGHEKEKRVRCQNQQREEKIFQLRSDSSSSERRVSRAVWRAERDDSLYPLLALGVSRQVMPGQDPAPAVTNDGDTLRS